MDWMLIPVTLFVLLLMQDATTTTVQAHASSEDLAGDDDLTIVEQLSLGQAQGSEETIDLITSLGTITGLVEPTFPPHYENTKMHAFRGIPFAKPPVGTLRFSDPVDLTEPWPGKHLSAIQPPSSCPLYDPQSGKVFGKEDCLYLNVFTPSHLGDKNREEDTLLPVLAYFHGGAFMRGSSSPYGAGKLLSRDIVVVTVNYRLGALGYLSMGDSVLPGNYGMLDQISALRWIQRNIAQFGGDPNQVTIGGFSAGSASVNFHAHSPLSKNLFHRGIMNSGASFCHWATKRNPKIGARLLAQKLECPSETSEVLRECLASKTSDQIVAAQGSIHILGTFPFWFVPVVDGGLRPLPFLPARPEELTPHPTPMIIGVVPDEGLLYSVQSILLSKQPANVSSVYEEASRTFFTPWHDPDSEEAMMDLAEAFYYSKEARIDGGVLIEQLTEGISDRHLGHCVWDSASHLAESGSTVYTYVLTHRDPGTPVFAAPLYRKVKALGYETPLLETGVSHGDDLVHMFDLPLKGGEMTERDQRVGQLFLHMFTNFVVSGHPQDDLEKYNIADIPNWEPLQPGKPVGYYEIGVNPTMRHRPFKEKEQNFWKNIVPHSYNRRYIADAPSYGTCSRSSSESCTP
ncbi:esterase E4-like [Palaemon carinicauda]|uniref:esterase E4-like n=1 Tax=Palaemon carinicauda TaxID=392227 RepID=UPI0035B59B28